MKRKRDHPPPWIFCLTAIPYGIVGSFCGTTMPFLTRQAGVSVDAIGWFGFAALVPTFIQFLYAPIVDLGPKRRVWLVLVATVGAVCLGGAMLLPLPKHVTSFMILVVAGQLISGLVGSCNGGLMASTLPDEIRGKASGWLNVGNLTGGSVGVVATMYWSVHWPRWATAIGLVMLIALPALAALTIHEPDREERALGEVFRGLFRDVAKVVRSRPGWTGILFCLSPVGTTALTNYFSGLAVDFHAGPGMVSFVNGWANGLVSTVGALAGGYLCDRVNRRAMYLISGGLTAVCAIVMATAPLNATTYAVGVTTYLLIAGFCFSAFTSVVLEAIGKAGPAAATQYTLFTSAGNAAIAYTGLLDTRFHDAHGVPGVLLADGAANLIGIGLLGLMIAFLARRARPEVNLEVAS